MKYEKPDIELFSLDDDDIIRTSVTTDPEQPGIDEDGEDWL